MLKLQIQDRKVFVDKAKEMNVPISVIRGATVVPVVDGNAVTMRPGIEIKYVIRFREAGEDYAWVHYEVKLEENGHVDLHGTLWEELQKTRDPEMVLGRRAGSY